MASIKPKKPVKIVVDTNIIFSALLNSNGTIGDLLFNSDHFFEFYSPSYMRYEIEKHWVKLKKISKLSDENLLESKFLVFSKINLINEEIIPIKIWHNAEKIVEKIDIDDIDFVALTAFLKAYLWTGDKVLYNGLKQNNFNRIYSTSDLISKRDY